MDAVELTVFKFQVMTVMECAFNFPRPGVFSFLLGGNSGTTRFLMPTLLLLARTLKDFLGISLPCLNNLLCPVN